MPAVGADHEGVFPETGEINKRSFHLFSLRPSKNRCIPTRLRTIFIDQTRDLYVPLANSAKTFEIRSHTFGDAAIGFDHPG